MAQVLRGCADRTSWPWLSCTGQDCLRIAWQVSQSFIFRSILGHSSSCDVMDKTRARASRRSRTRSQHGGAHHASRPASAPWPRTDGARPGPRGGRRRGRGGRRRWPVCSPEPCVGQVEGRRVRCATGGPAGSWRWVGRDDGEGHVGGRGGGAGALGAGMLGEVLELIGC
jgi:hypothetical protein